MINVAILGEYIYIVEQQCMACGIYTRRLSVLYRLSAGWLVGRLAQWCMVAVVHGLLGRSRAGPRVITPGHTAR